MDYKALVLNKLLDKFEVRTEGSNRRVLIKCNKKEINIPDIESDKYNIFRNDMLSLKSLNYIDFDWVQKNYIIDKIWLTIDNVSKAYRYLGRENKNSKINYVIDLIDSAINETEHCWVCDYFLQTRDNIVKSNKLTGIWNGGHKFITDFTDALVNISKLSGKSVSMRAFSVNVYGDSKYFEREIKQYVVSVIKNFEPDLSDPDEISDREALAQVGIIMMPEIFEFCGNVKILFDNGTVDFSPIKKGACISSECVSDICRADIFDTDRIIFIENKTNYSEYCLNNKNERELVVYHGGFYSPQRGEFFSKLCSKANIPVCFWGDIDYGGFKMFVRLKKNIINNLQPFNMDISAYNSHKKNGLKKNDNYILKLKELLNNPDYTIFYDVISAIILEKITVEQESFIENELL
ncbi:MAG: DUF2220 domain-containing protein [Ruminococcus sp.]|nr:DUF2220 domain-containing protein [Ruminococcus sp.]MCM1381653.1 DUF2220 domain-containing protein [Muribaculaceae bacterium]MCM1478458.1 DUF2220 domain-containing protein [Muribaculaceae bacterium]